MQTLKNSKEKGAFFEEKAMKYLEENGFLIVDRNFYTKFGEIDIIASKDNILHFIEVKSGMNFEPIFNITQTKISRLIKTAQMYILKNSLDLTYSFDAIIIKNQHIEFYENITM